MARNESKAKLGFYPIADECIPLLLKHLDCTDPVNTVILDPCAGEGAAIKGIAAGLRIPEPNVHACELDIGRSQAIRTLMPECRLLGPATFLGTRITHNSFSMVYCNPPYDTEMGGGNREELNFFTHACFLLETGGIFVFVLPNTALFSYGRQSADIRRSIACRLKHVEAFKLPPQHRNFGECVVIGIKRSGPIPTPDGILAGDNYYDTERKLPVLGTVGQTFTLPEGKAPKYWDKIALTPIELEQRVFASPLSRALEPPKPKSLPIPPLPPGEGHIAVLLASGHADGLVEPEDEPPHVVRGTAYKATYLDHELCETTVDDNGNVDQKTVYSQVPVLMVRAIGPDGVIHTLKITDQTDQSEEEEQQI